MGFLKYILLFIFISVPVYSLELKSIKFFCNELEECKVVKEKFESLIGKNITEDQLYAFINIELEKSFYEKLSFTVSGASLDLHVEVKEVISGISFEAKDKELEQKLLDAFKIKVGTYFDEKLLQDAIYEIQEVIFSNQEGSLSYRLEHDEGVKIIFKVNSDKAKKIRRFTISGVSQKYKDEFERYWSNRTDTIWDKTSFKRDIETFEDYLHFLGFWHAEIFEEVDDKTNYVNINIKIMLGKRYGFSFSGNSYFDHSFLVKEIKKSSFSSVSIDTDTITQILTNLYKSKGVFYSIFNVRSIIGEDESGAFLFYFIEVKEGRKIRIGELSFTGNQNIETAFLQEILDKNASDLIKNNYLDIENLNNISAKIREYCVSQGFIYSKVDEPYIHFTEDGSTAFVSYKVIENDQYRVGNINVVGILDKQLIEIIKNKLNNKEKKIFNVLDVDNDLKKALDVLKQEGYFFSSYTERNPKEIVQIDSSKRLVNINLKFETGAKSYLGDILVTGNEETKDIVVKRELRTKKGEIVTPTMINDYINRLRSLGLFSSVDISPFIGKNIDKDSIYLNFIVKVKEKDFGRGEVAPGFRTDLGAKISFSTSYNNWGGMNRSWLTKVQANYRTTLADLDKERQIKDKKLLEGIVQLQYVEPYLFSSFFENPLEFRTTLKFQRKRYNSFDADIVSIAPSFNKMLHEKVQFNLSYEFDVIRQFDATLSIDNDRYRIGAITPSITFENRDDTKAPRTGMWVNFTWEFANPYFLSQKDTDLTINYSRAMLRTFFYVPFWKFTLATSVTLGAETNFANEKLKNSDGTAKIDSNDGNQETRGYIPSLKVFRLSGLDFLRGFSDRESNRLISGEDVSDVIVRDSAYLINLKLELRHYFDDTTAVALFADAGRVFVDKVENLDLRTSAGFSFKLLTQVGSLDFDYGVKLRREYQDDDREKFGRFHVTIGQF